MYLRADPLEGADHGFRRSRNGVARPINPLHGKPHEAVERDGLLPTLSPARGGEKINMERSRK